MPCCVPGWVVAFLTEGEGLWRYEVGDQGACFFLAFRPDFLVLQLRFMARLIM